MLVVDGDVNSPVSFVDVIVSVEVNGVELITIASGLDIEDRDEQRIDDMAIDEVIPQAIAEAREVLRSLTAAAAGL